jgi:hypothetical protein
MWYKNGVQVIPDNIEELLTPVSLAHLQMGEEIILVSFYKVGVRI